MADSSNPSSTAWYTALPEPRNTSPKHITRAELLQRLQGGQRPGVDFLLIDLRRTDHEVSRGAYHSPIMFRVLVHSRLGFGT